MSHDLTPAQERLFELVEAHKIALQHSEGVPDLEAFHRQRIADLLEVLGVPPNPCAEILLKDYQVYEPS